MMVPTLFPKNKRSLKAVKIFIVVFYFIGILGFLAPTTRELFMILTPYALLLSMYLLFIYHPSFQIKDITVFAFIYLLGFFIEVYGVHTGTVFGHYFYGNALGPKILNTPLLIGCNWLFLTYVSTSMLIGYIDKKGLQIILAPTLMLVYDIFLERVAGVLDMWHWFNNVIPYQNYIAWWFLGMFFSGVIVVSGINIRNPLASILFICQFAFFLSLNIVFIIIYG